MSIQQFPLPAGGVPSGDTAGRPSNPSIGDTYYNGELVQLEIYTDDGWVALGATPGLVSNITVSDVGTGRAFNNGAVQVSFTAPSGNVGGSRTFTAVSSPGSFTASGEDSPVTVQGLQSNTAYTFNVTGTNAYGTSGAVTSPSTTATTVPDAPGIGAATNVSGRAFGSAASASVAFTAPATGGKTITGYTVTSTPGSFTGTGTASPIVVGGLTAGTAYTFSVKATNANGESSASNASTSLTVATVPDAPTVGTASVTGPTTVSLTFTAASSGGAAITSYVATSSPAVSGGLTVSAGTSSPLTINGNFEGSTAYTFQIAAVNPAGTGSYSGSSNSVTPLPSQPFSITVPSANTLYSANVSLSSGTYNVTSSSTSTDAYVHFNGPSGYLGSVKTTGGTASVTLTGLVSKVGVHTNTGSNIVVTVGSGATSVTPTAVTGGTLDTISATGTYTATTGWAFVVAVGGASGPGGGDNVYNSYGGTGGFSGTINGAYMYLTGTYTATVGAKGNSGPAFTAGNDGGATVFNGLTALGGSQNAPTRGAAGGNGGGNSWSANNGSALTNPYTFAKTGTTGGGGGGTPGGSSGGGDGGIGRGGGNVNGASTGYGAGGRGGNAGESFSGGTSTDGVIYVLKGIS